MDTETTTGFDLNAAADEVISNESQETATQETSEVESDKQTAPQENSTETNGNNVDEILGKLNEEKEDPKASEDLLKFVNELGATHNGLPVTVENKDQLKEYLQKGFDYTKKTMAHSETVKAWEESKAKAEAEWKQKEETFRQVENDLAEVSYENQIAEAVILEMKNTDPDLFEYFKNAYTREHTKRQQLANNPVIKEYGSKLQELNGQLQSLKGEKTKEELNSVKQSWDKDLTTIQTKYAPITAKLGVKIDWDKKVKDIWAADVTGKMTVEQALHAAHGAEIQKAYESHQKMLATKNKASNSMLKRTGASGNASGKQQMNTNFKPGEYNKFLEEASKNIEE